jgi:large subunit ribosomal protein L30e
MASTDITEIQKALESKKLVIGTDLVIKGLKNRELTAVFVSKNTPEIVRSDVRHYAQLAETRVVELEESNEDLKEICKKPFLISLLATKK